jgi:hypothetical protein
MKDSKIILSKSKAKTGFNCPKALYLKIFNPDIATLPSQFDQRLLHHGKIVGEAARKQFANGILVSELSRTEAIARTKELLEKGTKILFEPAFEFEGFMCRVDILRRADNEKWDLIEVKATTYNKPKKDAIEDYTLDISIQIWILENLGFPINKAYLMHLNSDCIYPDEGNLFKLEDFTDKISDTKSSIPERLSQLVKLLKNDTVPETTIGRKCDKPHECSFKSVCWAHVPEISIFNIPRYKKKWDLHARGLLDIQSVDEADFNTITQKKMIRVSQSGERFIDKRRIAELLQEWQYPLIFLDFESIDSAIPKYNNSRPYQHIPFQFSCHIDNGEILKHYEYLHDNTLDPREELIRKLLTSVPEQGTVVVYSKTYEATRLKELARDFPQYAAALLQIEARLEDLLEVIEDTVYDINFKGSFSIKKVAPALLGEEASYENLAIKDGTEAMVSFERLVDEKTAQDDKDSLKQHMLEYCRQDTLLMVKIFEWLKNQ